MTAANGIDMPRREPSGPCLILGYDRCESARHAVNWATSELKSGGKLVIVHACRPLHMLPAPLSTPDERHQFERALLDELMLDGNDELLDIEFVVEVSDEDPVTALTEAARRHHASAIVVGCEQHSRLQKAIGTVTSELLARSSVPVTAVPCARAGLTVAGDRS
ncbi:MAG TPA: universal stress protein [Solirubrobacteraceae bacterium]|jgi:nucleotide-binding universal stress UspA family protein|nr:universal stress protein [Solirubrobacteraceae bacterium]